MARENVAEMPAAGKDSNTKGWRPKTDAERKEAAARVRLDDAMDSALVLSYAVSSGELEGAPVLVARFLDRMAQRASYAVELHRRIEAANVEGSES